MDCHPPPETAYDCRSIFILFFLHILSSLHSTFCSEIFTFYITNLTLYILQIKLNTLLSTLYSFYFLFTFYIITLHFTLYKSIFILYFLQSILYTLQFSLYNVILSTFCILKYCTLNSELNTFFCNLYTPNIYFVHSPINNIIHSLLFI